MQAEPLIQSLIEQIRQHINTVEKLRNEELQTLTWKENPTSWSILECLEHLNLYGDFYLPEIEKKIKQADSKNEDNFKSGILGNYFAQSMLPKEKLNKMKTFKDKNPLNTNLDRTVIDRFLDQQIKLLELLNLSRKVSLNKVKIDTSISKLIKLKLGDTFQFFINHISRHIAQIIKIENAQKSNSSIYLKSNDL